MIELNNFLEEYLDNLPPDFEPDLLQHQPILGCLSDSKREEVVAELSRIQNELIEKYMDADEIGKREIRQMAISYEYLFYFLDISIKEIEEGDNGKSLILQSLIITSIKDLNIHNDIRDLIVYVNNLKNLAFKNNIDFNQLLVKAIDVSSDKAGVYSISMKSFFQNVLNNKPIPISLNS